MRHVKIYTYTDQIAGRENTRHEIEGPNNSALKRDETRGSAIPEGPRDALSQLKFCQLLYKCTKNRILKDLH